LSRSSLESGALLPVLDATALTIEPATEVWREKGEKLRPFHEAVPGVFAAFLCAPRACLMRALVFLQVRNWQDSMVTATFSRRESLASAPIRASSSSTTSLPTIGGRRPSHDIASLQ
jgi:hypothetical protein